MSRAAALVLVAVTASGCASVRAAGAGLDWSFPLRYEANQIVSIDLAEGPRELIASVRRDGHDVEVTLFDPSLAVPVLAGRLRDGVAEEQRFVESVPAGWGERLVRLISDLHGQTFPVRGDEGVAGGLAVRYRVGAFAGEGSCRFPRRIEVTPRGPGPRIRVETIDVACAGR